MSDDRSARIESKIDKLADALGEVRAVLAADREARKALDGRIRALEADVKPIRKHVSVVQGVAMCVTFAGGLKGLAALVSLFQR